MQFGNFLQIQFLKLSLSFFLFPFFTSLPTSIYLPLILLSNFRWHFKSFYSFWPMTCLSVAHRHSKPIPTTKHLFCVYQCHFGGKKCPGNRRLAANYYYITLCGSSGGVQPSHLADGTIFAFPAPVTLNREQRLQFDIWLLRMATRVRLSKTCRLDQCSGITFCLLDSL